MQDKPSKLSDRAEAAVLDRIVVRLIEPREHDRWNQLVSQHHYLKNANLVGERLCRVAEYQGQWPRLLDWSAAAYHIGPRDQWIGWSANQRRARLRLLANNARYCLLTEPGQYPNLASRAQAWNLARLSKVWQQAYGQPQATVLTITFAYLLGGGQGGNRAVANFARDLSPTRRTAARCWFDRRTRRYDVPTENCIYRVLKAVPVLEFQQGWSKATVVLNLGDVSRLWSSPASAGNHQICYCHREVG